MKTDFMTIPYNTVSCRTLAYLRLNSEGGYFMAISDWAEELAVLAPVRGIAADTELGGGRGITNILQI